MSKVIIIKLTKASPRTGPFTITDQYGNIIDSGVSVGSLIEGVTYEVDNSVTMITLTSSGRCVVSKTMNVTTISPEDMAETTFTVERKACVWRHLTNPTLYNSFYGKTEPYVIEYCFAYQYYDEIVQNVKDYTKAYKYSTDNTGVFNYNDRVETDDAYFNKVVVYNGQQSSGLLELVPKPRNNMRAYMQYPIYNTDSKTITFTKSDNFYQYNIFWDVVKDKTEPLFITSCESLSSPKEINTSNMDYSTRSFRKGTIRAKELKIRHCLDNRSDIHLVSQFLLTPSQISYK